MSGLTPLPEASRLPRDRALLLTRGESRTGRGVAFALARPRGAHRVDYPADASQAVVGSTIVVEGGMPPYPRFA